MHVFRFYVFVDDLPEFVGELIGGAGEGFVFLTVHVDGAAWRFAGAGEADADVGGFRFAGAIYDATHHGKLQVFEAVILLLPLGHLVAHVGLRLFGEFLEDGARRAAAAGACGYAGCERAEAERLQNLAGRIDFFAAIAAGAWRE